jgi:ABC-type transport system substrate-binding protein
MGKALAAAAVAILLLGAAPTAAGGASPSPSGTVTLHVGWTAEPDNLNPFIGFETSVLEMFHLNYDFLVGFRASDLQPVPELATSWSHSSDGKVWTFKLREGVKWQDDVPFTAKDVAFTYNYIVKNQMSNFMNYTDNLEKVEVVDDHTVRFVCSKPKANMLGQVVWILPEHIWSKVSPKAAARTYPNNPPLIGTGPFKLVEWKKGQYVRMVANKDYWRGSQGRRDHLRALQEPGHHGGRPQERPFAGGLGHPASSVRCPRQDARSARHRRRAQRLQPLGVQLLRGQRLPRQPGAEGLALPSSAGLGHRQAARG